ncbi:MAG: hypothetical protein KDA85_09475, partial [Planctomycetaceae bacterium]|nr:hypothetical protein [Planctomycetaceae bacterium]
SDGVVEDFHTDGTVVLERDPAGRVVLSQPVQYAVEPLPSPGMIVEKPRSSLIRRQYASVDDQVGTAAAVNGESNAQP